MINNNRIVPVTETSLIDLYGIILKDVSNIEKFSAVNAGEFEQATNSKVVLCDEPVKTFNFGSSVTAATVYFVPALDFAGFTKTSNTLTVSGTVVADGASLYSATLSTNALTLAKVGL